MKIKKILASAVCLTMCLAVTASAGFIKSKKKPSRELVNDIVFDEFGDPIFTDENGNEYSVDLFIPVRDGKKRPMEKTLELLRADDGVIPEWLIPFAEEDGGNLFCFSVRESDLGAIYYYDHEFEYGEDPEEHITWLAESITAFIDALTENEDAEDGEDNEE